MDEPALSRRGFLQPAASMVGTAASGALAPAAESADEPAVVSRRKASGFCFSCKLGMIAKEGRRQPLSLAGSLKMAAQAGFDGVDLDEPVNIRSSRHARPSRSPASSSTTPSTMPTGSSAHLRQRGGAGAGRANIEHCIRLFARRRGAPAC